MHLTVSAEAPSGWYTEGLIRRTIFVLKGVRMRTSNFIVQIFIDGKGDSLSRQNVYHSNQHDIFLTSFKVVITRKLIAYIFLWYIGAQDWEVNRNV
jgi:hypothetical protein